MAATIARAIGRGKNIEREGTRLGTESSEAQANTFKTFTTAYIRKDGSGEVSVHRMIGGKRQRLGMIRFGAETEYTSVDFYAGADFHSMRTDGVDAADPDDA